LSLALPSEVEKKAGNALRPFLYQLPLLKIGQILLRGNLGDKQGFGAKNALTLRVKKLERAKTPRHPSPSVRRIAKNRIERKESRRLARHRGPPLLGSRKTKGSGLRRSELEGFQVFIESRKRRALVFNKHGRLGASRESFESQGSRAREKIEHAMGLVPNRMRENVEKRFAMSV
jgi:hypothetical protein